MISTEAIMLFLAVSEVGTPDVEPVVSTQLNYEMESSLLNLVSWENSFVAKYNPDERIAFVFTPEWMPEVKPYQFDGENWVPLWSPFHEPGEETECPQ